MKINDRKRKKGKMLASAADRLWLKDNNAEINTKYIKKKEFIRKQHLKFDYLRQT